MAVTDHPLVGLGYARPSETREFIRLQGHNATPASAVIAEEVPVALVYNGRPYVVVMATPTDLEDLAVGFSVTEGIVAGASDLRAVEVVRASHGIEVQIEVASADAERLSDRARGLVSRTGCGLCGIETIGDALRVPAVVGSFLFVAPDALWKAASELSRRQTINNETSTVHGAGWATPDGELHVVREDVGRHNALDKVLGALARGGRAASGGFVVVTSRASYEMVQKAAMCGVELLAAISRPTGLAIRFADAANVTLAALVRGESGNVYCHPHRISPTQLQE
ncbi:MAG TPA: formate dehydrogenase accessory sulfurtransferase FdhD [Gemmatimonadaceae bacterium]